MGIETQSIEDTERSEVKVKTVSYAKLVSFERFNNHRAEVVIEVEEGDIAQEVLETAKALVDQALEVEEKSEQGVFDWPQEATPQATEDTGFEVLDDDEEDMELGPEDEAPKEAL
jgi:hypothetical protein